MRILMIGGTGVISTEVSKRILSKGWELYLLNRGTQTRGIMPEGAKWIHCDARDGEEMARVCEGMTFDVVVDWISYTQQQLRSTLDALRGKYGQLIFISSCAVYSRELRNVTEDHPRENLAWSYARDKIGCEEYLKIEDLLYGCNWTVVRPAVTYGDTRIPCAIIPNLQWTLADRMLQGKPIVMHDDGSARMALTHSSDFAKGIVGLMGNSLASRQAYHILSEEYLSWKEIAEIEAEALGVTPKLAYISSQDICREMPMTQQGDTFGVLLCNKACTTTYDTGKIHAHVPEFLCTTPFREGIARTMRFYREHPEFQGIDHAWNAQIDRLIEKFREG